MLYLLSCIKVSSEHQNLVASFYYSIDKEYASPHMIIFDFVIKTCGMPIIFEGEDANHLTKIIELQSATSHSTHISEALCIICTSSPSSCKYISSTWHSTKSILAPKNLPCLVISPPSKL